jgi:Arc-like DNA binding domain
VENLCWVLSAESKRLAADIAIFDPQTVGSSNRGERRYDLPGGGKGVAVLIRFSLRPTRSAAALASIGCRVLWFHFGSRTILMLTLTLKNIPEDLHAMLKDSAQRNRRSLNSEILARLERELAAPTIDPRAHAKQLKAFTARLPKVEHARVSRNKHQGRA